MTVLLVLWNKYANYLLTLALASTEYEIRNQSLKDLKMKVSKNAVFIHKFTICKRLLTGIERTTGSTGWRKGKDSGS